MALTLAEAKVTQQDKIDQFVIDEFRRSSFMLDNMTFDDAISPGTGGSTLTYGYTRLKTPATATGRAINSEYTANQALREKVTTDLKIFGGSFELDRVLQNTSGSLDEINFQLQEKIKGAKNYFHYQVVNGDSGVDANTFDGLNKILTGSSTEINTDEVTDLTEIATREETLAFQETLDDFLSELDGRPSMLFGNTKLINKIKSVARWSGYYSRTEDAFGTSVDNYDNIPIINLDYYFNGTSTVPVVPIVDRTISGSEVTGLTDLYAVNLALNGFHGITPQGGVGISSYLPDLSQPGAVKKGEVEMVAGVCLKATRKAGVLRNIKVQ
jgi:hypothetical protein